MSGASRSSKIEMTGPSHIVGVDVLGTVRSLQDDATEQKFVNGSEGISCYDGIGSVSTEHVDVSGLFDAHEKHFKMGSGNGPKIVGRFDKKYEHAMDVRNLESDLEILKNDVQILKKMKMEKARAVEDASRMGIYSTGTPSITMNRMEKAIREKIGALKWKAENHQAKNISGIKNASPDNVSAKYGCAPLKTTAEAENGLKTTNGKRDPKVVLDSEEEPAAKLLLAFKNEERLHEIRADGVQLLQTDYESLIEKLSNTETEIRKCEHRTDSNIGYRTIREVLRRNTNPDFDATREASCQSLQLTGDRPAAVADAVIKELQKARDDVRHRTEEVTEKIEQLKTIMKRCTKEFRRRNVQDCVDESLHERIADYQVMTILRAKDWVERPHGI